MLRHVASGETNSTVAARLWVSDQTIKFHLTNIYRKLHVKSRHQAAQWAKQNGLLT